MYSLIILSLISYVQAQQHVCLCFCCTGVSCSPYYVGTLNTLSCAVDTCRTSCRNSYAQCQTNYPYGQIETQCVSNPTTLAPSYNCQCNCCRTGSTSCTPVFVGYSAAYLCQPGPCSIACNQQYQYQCSSDSTGQTQGICTGLISTTTTTTTTTSTTISSYWRGNPCSCTCCRSGPNCTPNIAVGNATAVQCSSEACIAACQYQYPNQCPSIASQGQTNGVCTNPNIGNTRCQCQCCATCSSYEIITNMGCSSCSSLCQQRCGNITGVAYTCNSNKSIQSSFPLINLIIIFILPFYSTL